MSTTYHVQATTRHGLGAACELCGRPVSGVALARGDTRDPPIYAELYHIVCVERLARHAAKLRTPRATPKKGGNAP